MCLCLWGKMYERVYMSWTGGVHHTQSYPCLLSHYNLPTRKYISAVFQMCHRQSSLGQYSYAYTTCCLRICEIWHTTHSHPTAQNTQPAHAANANMEIELHPWGFTLCTGTDPCDCPLNAYLSTHPCCC